MDSIFHKAADTQVEIANLYLAAIKEISEIIAADIKKCNISGYSASDIVEKLVNGEVNIKNAAPSSAGKVVKTAHIVKVQRPSSSAASSALRARISSSEKNELDIDEVKDDSSDIDPNSQE